MATNQQIADFIATELPFAQRESKRTGIPTSIFLTQSGVETGWGTSQWFRRYHNPAGIGVTGAAGKGYQFASLSDAFTTYANKLLGIGEAGQQQFVRDVNARASDLTLLQDLERAPWAAGHYGGHGLEGSYSSLGLGQYDVPGAKPPAGGNAIPNQTAAYIPGTHVHIPGTGAGGSLVPDNPVTGAIAGLTSWIESVAVRTGLVIFGAIAILVGLTILFHSEDEAHAEHEEGAAEGRTERAASAELAPSERPAASSSSRLGSVGTKRPAPVAGERGAGKAAASDVRQTASGAAEAAG